MVAISMLDSKPCYTDVNFFIDANTASKEIMFKFKNFSEERIS